MLYKNIQQIRDFVGFRCVTLCQVKDLNFQQQIRFHFRQAKEFTEKICVQKQRIIFFTRTQLSR